MFLNSTEQAIGVTRANRDAKVRAESNFAKTTPVHSSEIEYCFRALDDEIAKLEAKTSHLRDVLIPVLADTDSPANPTTSGETSRPINSPIGKNMRVMEYRLEILNDRLAYILDHLAI